MALAGQVGVKFTADTAEYTKATEKVRSTNGAVGDSVKQLAQQAESVRAAIATPHQKFAQQMAQVKELVRNNLLTQEEGAQAAAAYARRLNESVMGASNKWVEMAKGGAAIALLGKSLEMAAQHAATFRKNIMDGASGLESFVDTAYDIPVTGAVLRLGDAITGSVRPSELREKMKEMVAEAYEAKKRIHELLNERVALNFEVRKIDVGAAATKALRGIDKNAAFASVQTAMVESWRDATNAMTDESLKHYTAVQKTLTEGEAVKKKMDEIDTRITRIYRHGGDRAELGMLHLQRGLYEQILDRVEKLKKKEEERHQGMKRSIEGAASDKVADAAAEARNKALAGAGTAAIGGAVGLWNAAASAMTSYFTSWKTQAASVAAAEDMIREAKIDQLQARASLGDAEAARAAERLRIEGEIAHKRAEFQRIATNNQLPQEIRAQAEAAMKGLEQTRANMLAAVDRPQLTYQAPTATPQLSANVVTGQGGAAGAVPEKQLDQAKKTNQILEKVHEAVKNPFKVFKIFG